MTRRNTAWFIGRLLGALCAVVLIPSMRGSAASLDQLVALTIVRTGHDVSFDEVRVTIYKADGSEDVTCDSSNQQMPCQRVYPKGTTLTLEASSRYGRFAGWVDACVGAGRCTLTLDGNKRVGAVFLPENEVQPVPLQTLTVTRNAGFGAITIKTLDMYDREQWGDGEIQSGVDRCELSAETPSCTYKLPQGSSVTLMPKPAAPIFASWGGACVGKGDRPTRGTCRLVLEHDQAVTATFRNDGVPIHKLLIAPSGWGATIVARSVYADARQCNVARTDQFGGVYGTMGWPCLFSYPEGTSVRLQITSSPVSHYYTRFLGFFGQGCSGGTSCELTMSADQRVDAKFQQR